MISPLQEGPKRRIGWDGPTLAGPRGTRRRLRRRVGAAAGVLIGVVGWLTLGASDVGEPGAPSRLDLVGILAAGADAGRPLDARERSGGSDAELAALSLDGEDTVRVSFGDPPAAGVLFDVDTGEVLWRRNVRHRLPIASLTKIMTALLVTEEMGRADQRIKIDPRVPRVEGSAVGLEAGMRVRTGALFHAMLVASANDAAAALAIETAGSVRGFVRRMNRRARRLELGCTRFTSPHGLEPGNRSCAADVAAITRLAMDEGRIRRVAAKRRAVVDFPIPGARRHLSTTNPLLQAAYRGTIGLKTGFTEEAGASLVAVVRRGKRTLAAVLLDSPHPAEQARRLLGAAFAKGRTAGEGRSGREDRVGRSRRAGQPSDAAGTTSGGPPSRRK